MIRLNSYVLSGTVIPFVSSGIQTVNNATGFTSCQERQRELIFLVYTTQLEVDDYIYTHTSRVFIPLGI